MQREEFFSCCVDSSSGSERRCGHLFQSGRDRENEAAKVEIQNETRLQSRSTCCQRSEDMLRHWSRQNTKKKSSRTGKRGRESVVGRDLLLVRLGRGLHVQYAAPLSIMRATCCYYLAGIPYHLPSSTEDEATRIVLLLREEAARFASGCCSPLPPPLITLSR